MRLQIYFTCLSICLLLPFALREGMLPIKTEPYPAVLFPSGARTIQHGEYMDSSRLEVFSLDSSGKEHRLPQKEFIHPIPAPYFPRIASERRKFGLSTEKLKEVSIGSGSWQLSARPHRTSTIEEKREVIRWLTARLRVVGRPLDRTIVVRSTTFQIDIATGDEINSETNFQYEINLDDYNS